MLISAWPLSLILNKTWLMIRSTYISFIPSNNEQRYIWTIYPSHIHISDTVCTLIEIYSSSTHLLIYTLPYHAHLGHLVYLSNISHPDQSCIRTTVPSTSTSKHHTTPNHFKQSPTLRLIKNTTIPLIPMSLPLALNSSQVPLIRRWRLLMSLLPPTSSHRRKAVMRRMERVARDTAQDIGSVLLSRRW